MKTVVRYVIYRDVFLAVFLCSSFNLVASLSWLSLLVTTASLMCWGIMHRAVMRIRQFAAWLDKGVFQ